MTNRALRTPFRPQLVLMNPRGIPKEMLLRDEDIEWHLPRVEGRTPRCLLPTLEEAAAHEEEEKKKKKQKKQEKQEKPKRDPFLVTMVDGRRRASFQEPWPGMEVSLGGRRVDEWQEDGSGTFLVL